MTPRIGLTESQTSFLRRFRDNPLGPPLDQWPSAAVLLRWLRGKKFRYAMQEVRDALRFQADLHLASAAARAAGALQDGVGAGATQDQGEQSQERARHVHALVGLLRLSHMRTRYTVDPPPPPPRGLNLYLALQRVHQDLPVGRALELMDKLMNRPAPAEKEAVVQSRRPG
jgi:hypothetical protein